MRHPRLAVLLAMSASLLALAPAGGSAATPKPASVVPQAGDLVEPAFRFDDGEVLTNLDLHYVTLGTPARDAAGATTNGVLLLHGTTGSAAQFLQPGFTETMFGAGQPLDAGRFFIVIPDGIGAGGSSKPSAGLGARFPHYGYGDQVRAQHDLVGHLGLQHLKVVLGTSMGGMQVWMWGETYPAAADALVTIAATPAAISGRNMLWRAMIIQALEGDPDWQGGIYPKDHPPRAWLRTAIPLFAIMTGDADHLQELAPTRDKAVEAVDDMERKAQTIDAADYLYTFRSSADYDPFAKLGQIKTPLLAINFADDLLNPPDLIHLPEGANIHHVLVPNGPDTFGHQTLNHPATWAKPLAAFLAETVGSP